MWVLKRQTERIKEIIWWYLIRKLGEWKEKRVPFQHHEWHNLIPWGTEEAISPAVLSQMVVQPWVHCVAFLTEMTIKICYTLHTHGTKKNRISNSWLWGKKKELVTCVYRVFSSHYCTTAGWADRWHIVIIQNHTAVCQLINIGCWNLIGSMKTHIIPTLISEQKKNDCLHCLLSQFNAVYILSESMLSSTTHEQNIR